MDNYRPRSIDPIVDELIRELPALLIVGPRATGKTTTALRHAATTVRLDQAAEADAFIADPDAALRGLDEPVLLDEWQAVPEVLGAVKRSVDTDPHPGRYLLTGSVRADLDATTWPGTGRVVRLPMYGMTIAEQEGRAASTTLFDRLADEPTVDALSPAPDTPDLRGYVELALRSGFPEAAFTSSDMARELWIESYIEQLLTRDAQQLDSGRDPALLRRFFEVYALNSAGIVEDRTLYESAGINRKTAVAYEQMLINLRVAEALPSWTSNRLKRLVQSPKRYLVDPALVAGILRVGTNGVLRDGNLLGRVLDTFVAAQLRAQLPVTHSRPRLYHLRDAQGRHEVDILGELGGQQVVALEVKANASPGPDAARHLLWLQDRLEDRFTAGVILHTGPRSYAVDDRIFAAPISTLWA